jgi:hypothetical protein
LQTSVISAKIADLEASRTVTEQMHKDMITEGKFFAHTTPGKNKSQWARQWVASIAGEFSNALKSKKTMLRTVTYSTKQENANEDSPNVKSNDGPCIII